MSDSADTPVAGGEREDKIQRAIDRWANAAVVGFQRESHMTLYEHVAWRMRSLVDEVSTLAAPRAREGAPCECDEDGVARSACITSGCQSPAPVVPAVPVAQMQSEWETPVAVKLHTAMCSECPAFPGSGQACEPTMCDCLCEHQDMTFDEVVDAACARLRITPPAPSAGTVTEAVMEAMRSVLAKHGSAGKTPEAATEQEFYERRGMEAVEQAVTAALTREAR